jgi:hypothetical protein
MPPSDQPDSKPVESAQQPDSGNGAAPDNPLLNAFMARVAVRGVKGELFVTNSNVENVLAKSGPVGEQVLDRLRLMEQRGWSYGPMLPLGDPYLSAVHPGNPLAQVGKYSALGGYNVSELPNTTSMRRIGYNNALHLVSNAFIPHGNASPLTRIAGTVAHEVGHYDGMPLSYEPHLNTLTGPQKKIIAQRLLQTETNAVLTQLHIADVNKAFHPDLEGFRAGLRNGTFGERLRANWTGPGVPPMYRTLDLLTPAEANATVNEHIARNYGDVIDKKGRVGVFDLNKVTGQYAGVLPEDEAILARMAENRSGVKAPQLVGDLGGKGVFMSRSLQALGGLGLAWTVSDIGNSFNDSTGSGFGKIGRIGVQYAGAEVGSMFGAKMGMRLAMTSLGKGKLGLITMPLSTIFGGMVGAIGADIAIGDRVDSFLRQAIDSVMGEGTY